MKRYILGLVSAFLFLLAGAQAQAAIVLTDFTAALDDVGDAVTTALGATVTAGLAISGVIMGGMLLWRLFRRIARA